MTSRGEIGLGINVTVQWPAGGSMRQKNYFPTALFYTLILSRYGILPQVLPWTPVAFSYFLSIEYLLLQ